MKVGDIKYRAFFKQGDEICVGIYKVIKISPKGKVITYEYMEGLDRVIIKDDGYLEIYDTKIEALKELQKSLVETYYRRRFQAHLLSEKPPDLSENVVKRIIEAQKLIDKLSFCSNQREK